MIKYKDRMWYKAVLWILLILSGISLVTNIAFVALAYDWGVYEKESKETYQENIGDANRSYSVQALYGYLNQTEEELPDGFQYGILKCDEKDLSKVDLKDTANYLVSHFTTDSWDEKELTWFNYQVLVTTSFSFYQNALWMENHIHSDTQYQSFIEKICYCKKNDTYYYKMADGEWLIPVLTVGDGEDGTVLLDGNTYKSSTIETISEKEVETAETNEKLVESTYQYLDDGELFMDTDNGQGIVGNFWVVSYYLRDTTVDTASLWEDGDRYEKVTVLNEIFYNYAYGAIVMGVISFGIALLCVILLCASAGHRKGKEGIYTNLLQRLPLEAEWFLFGMLVLGCLFSMALTLNAFSSYYNEQSFLAMISMLAVEGVVIGCLLVCVLINFAARIKVGDWWKNTFCYRIFAIIKRFVKRILGGINRNLPLFVKTVIVFAGISFVEFVVIVATDNDTDTEMLFWLFEKALLFAGCIFVLLQLKKLQEGSRNIAEGDLTHQIDTGKMLWEFKQHAENLNSISSGMSRAVEERMKSERFKTELITNVSHDIKTPLTSIINYVDLLEKEKLDNSKAEEYLEVLERQSARLKKLIEDLMEASKASTGNLAVHLERLEAGVFLVQTVGEFEEKTMASNLELLIQKPETPVYIMADGRHFWRVIDNLMNNICKYAQPGTRVYINLEVSGEEVLMTFRNTSRYALNISSEELMERFVRGDSSRNTEGSGLGLSIAQSLMELMNGKMELYVDGDLFKVVLHFSRLTDATE